MTTATLTPAEILAAHNETWDMPTLMESRPDILAWLSARFEVHFGIVSEVIIVHKATGKTRPTTTTDVRVALRDLLTDLAEETT